MRVPSENNTPAQPLTHLWERHKEIIRRLIAGERQKDIADDLGLSYSRMSIICNSPAFKSQLNRMSLDANAQAINVQDRITDLSEDAISILEDVLQDNNSGLGIKDQVKVAQDVLDRAGHSAVKKVHTMNETLTAEDIEEMRLRKAKTVNA